MNNHRHNAEGRLDNASQMSPLIPAILPLASSNRMAEMPINIPPMRGELNTISDILRIQSDRFGAMIQTWHVLLVLSVERS